MYVSIQHKYHCIDSHFTFIKMWVCRYVNKKINLRSYHYTRFFTRFDSTNHVVSPTCKCYIIQIPVVHQMQGYQELGHYTWDGATCQNGSSRVGTDLLEVISVDLSIDIGVVGHFSGREGTIKYLQKFQLEQNAF